MKKQLLFLSIMLLGATTCQGMEDTFLMLEKNSSDPGRDRHKKIGHEVLEAFNEYYACILNEEDAYNALANKDPDYLRFNERQVFKTLGNMACESALRYKLQNIDGLSADNRTKERKKAHEIEQRYREICNELNKKDDSLIKRNIEVGVDRARYYKEYGDTWRK